MAVKFIARLASFQRLAGDSDGELTFNFEWKRLGGDNEGGKYVFHSNPLSDSPDELRRDVRSALASHLGTQFPLLTIKGRDILVLLG